MSNRVILLLLTYAVFNEGAQLIAERYYEDVNCNKTENGQYDCGFLKELKKDKCYFGGVEYDVNKELPKEVLEKEAKCSAACRCRYDYPSNEIANWDCVHIECPELFRRDPTAVYKYTHDKCCAVSSEKLPELLLGPETEKEEPKCVYKGEELHIGQKFFPDEDSCLTCICGEGFKGELKEPWCKRVKCNVFLHYLSKVRKDCVPLYTSEDSCCPIYDFRCPSDDDVVITPKNFDVNKSPEAPKCKFGKLELSVGQSLSPKKLAQQCTECSCSVPPLVTCVFKDCSEGEE